MPLALVVTDAEWVRNDVRSALSIGNWRIEELDDPATVVDVVRGSSPDVLIADMQIKSMGGMAVIRAIRGEIETESRPFMVLLLDRSADVFLARRAGANAHVLKPFTAQDLRMALIGARLAEEEPASRPVKAAERKRGKPRRKKPARATSTAEPGDTGQP